MVWTWAQDMSAYTPAEIGYVCCTMLLGAIVNSVSCLASQKVTCQWSYIPLKNEILLSYQNPSFKTGMTGYLLFLFGCDWKVPEIVQDKWLLR